MSPTIIQRVESGSLPYLLSRPETTEPVLDGASAPLDWPVLCFLHGYDEGAPMPIQKALTRHGPLAPSSSPIATGSFIVIAPQLPVRGDIWYRYAEAVQEIVQHVQQRYQGSPQQTYLTGFSYGGSGVFDLGLAQPGLWRALWAVDPTRVPEDDPGLPVWLSSGQASRPRAGLSSSA